MQKESLLRSDEQLAELKGVRLVTVDDDTCCREMLREALERAGAEVQAVASAREALEKVQSCRPHALVSDIGMPEQDGYDLLRLLRSLPAESGGRTPAIALSAHVREADRVAARNAGYQAFAAKPVKLDELVSLIARLVEK